MTDFISGFLDIFKEVGFAEISFILILSIAANIIFRALSSASDKTFTAVKKTSHNRAKINARANYVVIYKAIKNDGFRKHLEDVSQIYFRKRVMLILYAILTVTLHISIGSEGIDDDFPLKIPFLDDFITEYFAFIILAFALFFDAYYAGVQDKHGMAARLANRIKYDKNYLKNRTKRKLMNSN